MEEYFINRKEKVNFLEGNEAKIVVIGEMNLAQRIKNPRRKILCILLPRHNSYLLRKTVDCIRYLEVSMDL